MTGDFIKIEFDDREAVVVLNRLQIVANDMTPIADVLTDASEQAFQDEAIRSLA